MTEIRRQIRTIKKDNKNKDFMVILFPYYNFERKLKRKERRKTLINMADMTTI